MGGKTRSLGQAILFFKGDATDLNKKLSNVTKSVGEGMKKVGKFMTVIGGAITGVMGLAVKAASDFESAFAGVRKTVDETEEGFKTLSDGLREMSLRMPTSAAGLAAIMEVAGQLGIKGVDNLLKFTETLARIADSSNIIGEEGALQLAQFMGVMRVGLGDVDRLGASIIALGNDFRTTEVSVLNIAQNLTEFGNAAGLTATEVFAIATGIASAGGKAEAAATTFSKIGRKMKSAMLGAADGIEKSQEVLEKFAKVAGITADEFAKKFKEEPVEAILLFLEGLNKIQEEGGDTARALGEIFSAGSGEAPDRMAREIGKVIGEVSEMRRAVELSKTAFDENTALIEESEKRYATFASQVAILKNTITDLAIDIGDILIPELRKLIDEHIKPIIEKIKEWIKENPELTEKIVKWTAVIGALMVVLGPLLVVLGSLITIIAAIASPIGIIIALIIAIIAVVVTFRKKIIENLKNLWSWISGLAKMAVDWIVDKAKKFWKNITGIFKDSFGLIGDLWGAFWDGLKEVVSNVWQAIIEIIGGAWETLRLVFTNSMDFLFPKWRDFWESLKNVLVNIFNWMSGFIERWFDGILNFIGEGIQLILRLIDSIPGISISGVTGPGVQLGPGSLPPGTIVGAQLPPVSPPPSQIAGSQTPGETTVNVEMIIQGNIVGDEGFARQLAEQISVIAWEGGT